MLKNSLFGDEEGEFIGYKIIELEDDTSISILCKPQGRIKISLLDQSDNGVEDAKIFLMKDDEIITKGSCGSDGKITITAPSGFSETYTLKMLYKGFLITEEEVRLGILRRIIPLTKSYKINVSDLEIKILDSNGEIPDFKIYISLTSNEMETATTLRHDTDEDEVYKFLNLYHADYNLKLSFNNFEIERLINISETTKIDINLYDLNLNVKDKWDLPFNTSLDVTLTSKDLEKTVQLVGNRLADDHYHFTNLFPGNYLLKIAYKSYVLEENISIPFEPDSTYTITFPDLMDLEVVVYDSHGNLLSNKDVKISRKGKEIENNTDDEGKTTFQVSPGRYDLKIFSKDNLIAERKIDVLNHVKYDIATIEEPLIPFVIMGGAVLILIGFVLHGYKRKEYGFFIIILSLMLAVVAVISPWWGISSTSSESGIESSTNMYLTPTEMITITSNDMIAGELASHDETFAFYVGLLPVLITIGIIIMFLCMIFIKIRSKKISILLSIITVLIFLGSITIFFMAMSEFTNITVGSLFGSGELEVNIPGENIYVTLICNWGLSRGFYLMLFSAIILLILTIVRIKKKI
jgi:hypothetical protein